MEKRQFHSVHEIWELFEIWYHLSTRKLVKDTPRESRDLFLEVIGSIDPASDIQPNLEIWPESRDADQVVVIDALRGLETRIRAERQKATNKQFLNAIIEGVGEEPREIHLALFVGEDPADIFERIAAGAGQQSTVCRSFFGGDLASQTLQSLRRPKPRLHAHLQKSSSQSKCR